MRPETDVREVFRLRRQRAWGAPRIAAATGVSPTQVGRWLRRGETATLASPMRTASHAGDDIRAIFTAACDELGVAWRAGGPTVTYVSRQDAVRILDAHVGPKS